MEGTVCRKEPVSRYGSQEEQTCDCGMPQNNVGTVGSSASSSHTSVTFLLSSLITLTHDSCAGVGEREGGSVDLPLTYVYLCVFLILLL